MQKKRYFLYANNNNFKGKSMFMIVTKTINYKKTLKVV